MNIQPDNFMKDLYRATYKGVRASIALGEDWVSIYSIESSDPNKGEATEFIHQIKHEYPEKTLYSSIPLNPIWKHLCDKHGIKYKKE
jgi:hypothetical protein